MGMWLGKSRQDCFVDSGFLDLDDVMPLGAPVIDFLRVDSERPDGWAHPSLSLIDGWRSNRGIPRNYPCTLDIRECVIGKATEEDWIAFDKWVRDQWDSDQAYFPSWTLSFDTEQVFITTFDWIEMSKAGATEVMFQKNQQLATSKILDNDGYLVEDKPRNIPGKIFFGDGLRWTAIVSLPI